MMDSLIQSLPEEIRKHIEGREYTIDDMLNRIVQSVEECK